MKLSEAELGEAFLAMLEEKGLAPTRMSFAYVTSEMACQQGIPDMVAAKTLAGGVRRGRRERLAEGLSSPASAQILSLLQREAPRTEAYLARTSGLSPTVIRRKVDSLGSLNLLEQRGGTSVVLSPAFPDLKWEFWAFELKLKDWRRALYQALRYQAFAHHTAVVLPEKLVHRVYDHVDVFRRLNVGVIALDPENLDARFVVKSRRRHPGSRFHYLFALGKFLGASLSEA